VSSTFAGFALVSSSFVPLDGPPSCRGAGTSPVASGVPSCSADSATGSDAGISLAAWAANHVLTEHRWDLTTDPVVSDRLVAECERAKVRLSYTKQTRIELAQVDPGGPFATETISIDQSKLSELCTELVRRSFSVCDAALHTAGVRHSDIDAVFLAGGASQLPMIRAGIAKYFGTVPRIDFDPMEVVSIGASLPSK